MEDFNPQELKKLCRLFHSQKSADELYQKLGFAYNADDLAEKIPEVFGAI